MTWYMQLPKIELHVHLEGAIPHAALFDLIQKYGGDRTVGSVAELEKRFEYSNFSQFIECWRWKNTYLRELEDFSHIAELTARDLLKQNIKYAEMFYSPSLFVKRGLEVQEITEAVRAGLSRVDDVEVALIADLVRDYGPESEKTTLEKVAETKSAGVIGIGIGGSEHDFPAAAFTSIFEDARTMGFRTNAHAGEAAGVESIWSAIRDLRVDRIGHGTRAYEDSRLVDYLAEHKIPLELCPISNVCTGVVEQISRHPISQYYKSGLIISVNTDDPKMFGNNMALEYQSLVENSGFTRSEICHLILLAIESSWLSADRKKSMMTRFKNDPAWISQ